MILLARLVLDEADLKNKIIARCPEENLLRNPKPE